jgi:hypothetical protein
MRPRVNHLFAGRTARGAFASLLLAGFASSAQEATPARSLDDRWIPSFALTTGVFWGRQHATVSSDCFDPDSGPSTPTSCNPEIDAYGPVLRQGADQNELAVTPYVGGNLSLETPVLGRLGRPRLFAGLELPYQFGIDRNVAQKERPTGIKEPDNLEAGETLDEGAMLGVGSRTRSEVQGLTFGANAGVAFSFEAFGKQFHVKPSANWLRTQITVRGRIEHGICIQEGGIQHCDVDGIQPPGAMAFTRIITLKGRDGIWLDGIGPGVDVEMETGHFGPYTVTAFFGGGGYYLLGDRSVAFEAQRTIGPDQLGDPVGYHANFSFRVSPWLYRAGLGLRLSWVGYD